MITKGYSPVPNSFTATVSKLPLTNREKFLLMVIGNEVYRFPEGRKTLSKELSNRFLQKLTGVHHSDVSRILRKFEKMGLIKIIRSHTKGQGSIIFLVPSGGNTPPDNIESGGNIPPNQKLNLKKEDLPIPISDSSLRLNKEKINPQVYCPETSPNCDNTVQVSPEQSNNNTVAINVTAAAVPLAALSDKALNIGKSVLKKKGFSSEEVLQIADRITASMTGKEIHNKDKYFIASCNKEVKKTTVKTTIHNTTAKTIEVREKTAPPVTEKQEAPAEVIKRIQVTAPTELFDVIMDIDNDRNTQRALSFMPGKLKKEALTGLYLAEFKKRHPEVKV
jgi:hypothetical protein